MTKNDLEELKNRIKRIEKIESNSIYKTFEQFADELGLFRENETDVELMEMIWKLQSKKIEQLIDALEGMIELHCDVSLTNESNTIEINGNLFKPSNFDANIRAFNLLKGN